MSEKPEHTSTLTLIRTLVSKHYFQLTSFLNWEKITVAVFVGHVDEDFSPPFFSRRSPMSAHNAEKVGVTNKTMFAILDQYDSSFLFPFVCPWFALLG